MNAVALALVLAADPVTVRVLEADKPTRLTIESKSIRCDDEAVSSPATIAASVKQLRLGAKECALLTMAGPATLTVDATAHHYEGTVRVVSENGLLRVTDELDLERYLVSVVGAEAPGAPKAAAEAQAIVSRTFALTAKRRHAAAGYDLCDESHCQLYRGQDSESPSAKAAVEKTSGQALLVGGITLKPAFFHAACGGHTSKAFDVFREDGAGPGVSDLEASGPLCKELPDFNWEWVIDRPTLAKTLGLGARSEAAAFETLRRDEAGRVVELKSFGTRFSGDAFFSKVARAFGPQTLRSLKMTVQEAESNVRFSGVGAGHGVGLCQTGAKALALKGSDAKAILKRYFPDSQVRVPELGQ